MCSQHLSHELPFCLRVFFLCSGALSALERCLLEGPGRLSDVVDRSLVLEVLGLLEKVSLLLVGVLYGAQDNQAQDNGIPRTALTWDWIVLGLSTH